MGMDLKNFVGRRVHFIGAGGCSMSGLARLMQQLGMEVTGSDRTASHKTEALVGGHPVQIGHEADLVRQANLVVYSAAIAPDNPEPCRGADWDRSSERNYLGCSAASTSAPSA